MLHWTSFFACNTVIAGTIASVHALGSTGIDRIVRKEQLAGRSRRTGSGYVSGSIMPGVIVSLFRTVFLAKIAAVSDLAQD
jgi:hypothetical protein